MAADVPSGQESRIRASQTIRVIVWLALLAILVVIALLNTEDARVDWMFGETKAPLFIVIAVSAAIGALIGATAVWRRNS